MEVTLRTTIALLAAVCLLIAPSATAVAGDEADPVTVELKDGETLTLKTLEVGSEQSGLLGTTFNVLDRLPVKVGELTLRVPIRNLARIEFLAVEDEGRTLRLKLTDREGEELEGVVEHKPALVWRGRHRFADAEAVIDSDKIKLIVLRKN